MRITHNVQIILTLASARRIYFFAIVLRRMLQQDRHRLSNFKSVL